MARTGPPPRPPSTALGEALARHRGPLLSQRQAAAEAGLPAATFARLERGTHQPSFDTAVALARWLGWSVEQVYEAARTPVDSLPGRE